jgi:CheY-like chemotaxis protein
MSLTRPDLSGIHVLVVDRDDATLETLGSHLRRLGATVTRASDPTKVLGLLTRVRAQVIVTEPTAPGVEGIEPTAGMEDARRVPPSPIIVVMADANRYLRAVMSNLRFRSRLPRPVDPDRLAREVLRLYDHLLQCNDHDAGASGSRA